MGVTRQGYIGKEKDVENGLGDHGVRKYDYNRFNSIDPLWEKYYGWSPYQYCMNNPIWAKDWDGREVMALDEISKTDILNSLPKEIRKDIMFSSEGLIDKESINSINVTDGNFIALKELVNSDVMTYVENRTDIIVKDMDGDGKNDSYPMESAFKGFTATPTSSDGMYLSIYTDAIHVQINANSNTKERAKYVGHELFGHALFFIQKKDFEHNYQGGVDQNIELKNFIFEREKNSEENYDK